MLFGGTSSYTCSSKGMHFFECALSLARLNFFGKLDIYYQWFRNIGDTPFFYQKRKAEKKPVPRKAKETDMDRFLIQIINRFYNAPALTTHPCAKLG